MKSSRTILTAGCLGFLLVVSAGADHNDRARPFWYSISGTNLPTTIDTNNDGETAGILSGEGKSTLGPISVQLLNEFVFDQDPENSGLPVFCALPDGTPGLQLKQILGTAVFQVRRADLLYAELLEGTVCLSLATCFDDMEQLQPGCIVSGPRRFEITGGTGKFAEASGEIEVRSSFEFLVVSPTGFFAAGVDVAEGEIYLPHAEEDDDNRYDDEDDDQ